MGVQVVQLTSRSHHDNILASLYQLRLLGQLSDVTVQVDYQGDMQEFQAHQVMLAASSGYFKKMLLCPDAARDKLLLSNMHSDDFSKFLEFVYTGKVEVARDKIVDVQAAAQFLDCRDLSDVCDEALSAGILQTHANKTSASEAVDKDDKAQTEQKSKEKRQPRNIHLKRRFSPQSAEKEAVSKKAKNTVKEEKRPAKKLKLGLADRKVPQRRLSTRRTHKNTNEDTEENEDRDETEAQSDKQEEKTGKSSLEILGSDVDEWECEEDVQSDDPGGSLILSLEEDDDDDDDDGQSNRTLKRTSKAQFQCNKCQRTFHYERSYLKHISTYHGVTAEVIYKCETCQQTFANRSNLKIHEKHVHSDERLFACDSCGKTFKRKKDVVRHQKQVHERNNLRYICPECGKALSSKTALVLHERTHTGAKPYECTDCGARFTQNSALKMHRRTHTGEKPYACDQCDARFTQKHMLAYHKRSHTGEKPFMCEACGKSFSSKEYLRHHANIHTGSKPYKCQHCNRGFAQRNSLHQHLKVHTGERPYSCKDCEKQFTQLNALQRHQRIHTGEKPYMCGLCSRTFTDKSTLRRHTMIHDSDAPWKNYLVVLEGNLEKPKAQTKGKTEKAGAGEKKSTSRKSVAGAAAAAAAATACTGDGAGKTHTETIVVPAEHVTLPPDWTSHGSIALVSDGTLGGITVIRTEMPPGTQMQPIVTTDGTGGSVISIDVPFPMPVSMAQPIPLCSEASSTSLSIPTLSVPISNDTLASVSVNPVVSTSSVLEAAASQTILAPVSEMNATPEADILPPNIQTVIVADKECENEQTVQSVGQKRTADDPLAESKGDSAQDTL
ncbi:hypothetical protein PAMA_007127 [Pampus argenteus]